VDYRDHAGIRRWKTFDTKREAEDFYADLLKTQDVRSHPTLNIDITLADYACHWIDTLSKARNVKPRTLELYKKQFRYYIFPNFPSDLRLRNLQRAQVKAFLLKMRAHLSLGSVKLIHVVLRAMLNAAIEDEIITVNVTTGLGKVLGLGRTKNKEDVKAMTREQVNAFFAAAPTAAGNYYAILFMMYQTGTRLGEARGFYGDDIALDRLEAHVQRTLDDDTNAEGLPKGGKDRTVDLSDQLVECLKRYKAKRAEWALAGGWGQSVPYFFVTTNGTPVGADEIRKVFKRVLQAAGLPRHFTPHCLRHTYASLLLQEDGGRLL